MQTMIWEFALLPLLVLPIVLLFRFVGCGLDAVATGTGPTPPAAPPQNPPATPPQTPPPGADIPVRGTPPNYRKYILGELPNPGDVVHPAVVPDGAAVIGYWRLTDPAAATIARDEKSARDGNYSIGDSLVDVPPTGALGGSESAPGTLLTGQPGLIASDPAALCRYYNGGYVVIPYAAGLHTDEFTLEAWVNVTALKADYEHVLFDTGGRYALPGSAIADRGYRLFADRDGNWQVRMARTPAVVFPMPPKVPLGKRTHVALVLKNHDAGAVQKDLTLFIDGKQVATALIPQYPRPDTAPLYIAAENSTAQPTQPARIRAPFLAQVQEVVLHGKALSVAEIENHVDINR
jgi:hypothetical protein